MPQLRFNFLSFLKIIFTQYAQGWVLKYTNLRTTEYNVRVGFL